MPETIDIHVRIPGTLHAALTASARGNHRSFNSELVVACEQYIAAQKHPASVGTLGAGWKKVEVNGELLGLGDVTARAWRYWNEEAPYLLYVEGYGWCVEAEGDTSERRWYASFEQPRRIIESIANDE